MSAWLLVKALFGFAAVGVLIRIAIGILRQQRAKARMEPENSHPGRVIARGVPIGRALREAAGELRDPQPPPPTMSGAEMAKMILLLGGVFGCPSPFTLRSFGGQRRPAEEGDWVRFGGGPTAFGCVMGHEGGGVLLVAVAGQPRPVRVFGGDATVLPFRPGQWLRRAWDGALVEFMNPSAKSGHSWILSNDHGLHPEYGPDDDFAPTAPREGEWWQKRPCPKGHPLPKYTLWSDGPVKWGYTVGDYTSPRCGASKPHWDALFAGEREACGCGCLAPVNFGLGGGPASRNP